MVTNMPLASDPGKDPPHPDIEHASDTWRLG